MIINNLFDAKRYLLTFGEVANYLGYSALKDYFPKYTMKPNPSCDNRYCISSQEKYQKYLAENPIVETAVVEKKEIVHDDNEWGICLVDSSDPEETSSNNNNSLNSDIPEGTKYWIEKNTVEVKEEEKVKVSDDDNLSSLMSQLAALKQ